MTVLAVFLRQLYLIKSNPTRIIGTFLWLVVSMTLWGFISQYVGQLGDSAALAVSVLGAIMLWEFLVRIQHGMMTSFLEDIWTQNFINFFSSPLRVSEYLGGLTLTSVVIGSIGFLLLLLITLVGFGFNIFMVGLMIVPFLIILILFGIATGIFVSGIIFRLGPSAEWLGWPIPFILSIVSGIYYPVDILPFGFQVFAHFIPSTYVFESLRSILAGGGYSDEVVQHVVIGFALTILYLLLAHIFFVRVYKRNLRTGSLAKFNTEMY